VSVKQRQLALAEDQYRYLKDIAGASNSSPNRTTHCGVDQLTLSGGLPL